MLRIDLGELKTLGSSLRSLSRRSTSMGDVAKFDRDKDGVVTGPDGIENVPFVEKPKSIESLDQVRERVKNLSRQQKAHELVKYAKLLLKENKPDYNYDQLDNVFQLGRYSIRQILSDKVPEYKKAHDAKIANFKELVINFIKENDHLPLAEIGKKFGLKAEQVSHLRRQAGLPPRRRKVPRGKSETVLFQGKIITRKEKDKIDNDVLKLFQYGYPISRIAEKTGYKKDAIEAIIRQMKKLGKTDGKQSTESRVLALALDGDTANEIRKQLHISLNEVIKIIEDAGGLDGFEIGEWKNQGKIKPSLVGLSDSSREAELKRRAVVGREKELARRNRQYEKRKEQRKKMRDEQNNNGEKGVDVINIDIKALGSTLSRAIPGHKPNIGKNPKDGDGDGFVVDLTTGLDNVPMKPNSRGSALLGDMNPLELADFMEEADREFGRNVRDGNVNRGKGAKIQRRYAEYWKRGGRMSFQEWSKRDAGRNPGDYRDDSVMGQRRRVTDLVMRGLQDEEQRRDRPERKPKPLRIDLGDFDPLNFRPRMGKSGD